MNERLKEKTKRKRELQQWRLQQAREKFREELDLRAKTTRAAKQQCKRLFPLSCLIKGYITVVNIDLSDPYPECIYECVILPQGDKQPGGRSAFSNREERYLTRHGIKGPPLEWTKPEWFEVEMYQ